MSFSLRLTDDGTAGSLMKLCQDKTPANAVKGGQTDGEMFIWRLRLNIL